MANKQAWEDFGKFIGGLNRAVSDVQNVARQVDELIMLKGEILDISERKAELKKIIDEHPDFTITGIGNLYTKLTALKDWLEQNNYLEE